MTLEARVDQLVREVMPRRLQKSVLQESMALQGELGIESIGLMSLAFRIEEEFQLDLMQHTDRVAAVRTIGDVRALVRDLVGGGR